jgi:hypothetical protein
LSHVGFLNFFLSLMNDRNNAALNSPTETSRLVSFAEAARFLGVDTFTFYAMVQREEIPTVFAASGELLVSQDDLEKLAGKD